MCQPAPRTVKECRNCWTPTYKVRIRKCRKCGGNRFDLRCETAEEIAQRQRVGNLIKQLLDN